MASLSLPFALVAKGGPPYVSLPLSTSCPPLSPECPQYEEEEKKLHSFQF